MTLAEHGGFDCSSARLQLYEYLDGEMGEEDCAKIREHLAQCEPCLEEYDVDQMLKALVRRSCGCESAPTELRTQIMSRITTIIVAIDVNTIDVNTIDVNTIDVKNIDVKNIDMKD